MAYVIQTGNIAQLIVRYAQSNTVEMMNVFHYRYMGEATLPDGHAKLLTLMEQFDTESVAGIGWKDLWMPLASNLVTLDKYEAQMVYPIRYGKRTWNVAITGSVDTDPLPSVVQWSITTKAELAARYGVGGKRIPGLGEDRELGGLLTAAAMTDAQALANHIPKVLNTGTNEPWEPIIYRRATPSASLRIVEAFPQEEVRSQRTRISFRGI